VKSFLCYLSNVKQEQTMLTSIASVKWNVAIEKGVRVRACGSPPPTHTHTHARAHTEQRGFGVIEYYGSENHRDGSENHILISGATRTLSLHLLLSF